MARYLVELYLSLSPAGDDLEMVAARARAGADEVRKEGNPVRYLRSTFVPEDEACFLLYEAPTAATVTAALTRAGLPSARVLEAQTEETKPEPAAKQQHEESQ